MTDTEMLTLYYSKSAARIYYIGFTVNETLYMIVAHDKIPNAFLRMTTTSKTKAKQCRVQITSAMAKLLVKDGKAIALDNADAINYNDQYNRGEHFERYIIERFTNTIWRKDNTPWYISGDAEINGEQVQIKFNGATLTDEIKVVKG